MDFSREYDARLPALFASPDLEAFFRGYNALDRDSLLPVVKSGLFRGLRRDLVRLTGRLVDFRGGAVEFLRAQTAETWVVSQSWYAEMVAEALRPAGVPPQRVVSSRLLYGADGTAGADSTRAAAAASRSARAFARFSAGKPPRETPARRTSFSSRRGKPGKLGKLGKLERGVGIAELDLGSAELRDRAAKLRIAQQKLRIAQQRELRIAD